MTAQEIGFTHMRILEGVGTLIQLAGLIARLCKMVNRPSFLMEFPAECCSEYGTGIVCNMIQQIGHISSVV
jgi:hypothetical protein